MEHGWIGLTLTTLDYADVEAVLDALRSRGFVEDDWCALNRRLDGSHVDWGPTEPPGDKRPYAWEVGT